MNIFSKTVQWGYEQGKKGIRKRIEQLIENKRLFFAEDNRVTYYNKQGQRREYSLEEFVKVAIEVGGWQEQMNTLGITEDDIKNILVELQQKYKGG